MPSFEKDSIPPDTAFHTAQLQGMQLWKVTVTTLEFVLIQENAEKTETVSVSRSLRKKPVYDSMLN